ncbi:polymer-forming cytoskeletal protein [Paenibacillus sp.]|uniref:bactofilin family protein n=1 Tax=Paenibacillus sp. TaxID=58172 RepID=UPI002D5E46A7|nr:polymer-forming cytoskeletal protein [Paenibacillus sp.]HZG55667.1 polymer-forming cytoskeletal protein [Paenibacillus sp.]
MFKKGRVDVGETDTLIGEGSVFEGNIKSQASLRIEGRMIGDIECGGDVTIGENGKAQSNIAARNVVVAGVVQGDITTRGTLTLTATGRLYGNLSAHSLVIAEGAVFQGASKMEGKTAAADGKATDKAQDVQPGGYAQNGGVGSTAV